jgi:DNA primase
VVAFGARRLNDQDEPKYINSPESSVFNKSATLYGLHHAAQEIRRSGVAIVTEGYMDTIACHQAGVRNAVATLGTALTREGARVLRRLCDTVVLLFDGDEAGQKAADRALEVFFAEPIDVRIATMSSLKQATGAKDPDELLKQEGGRERFDRMIASAVGAIDYRFARLRVKIDGLGLSARVRVIEEELARLADLGIEHVNPMRRQLITKQIAHLLGVDEQTVVASIPKRRARVTEASGWPALPAPAVPTGPRDARQHLLGCIMLAPSLLMSLEAGAEWAVAPEGFEDPLARQVAEAIARIAASGGTPDLRSVLASLIDVRAQSEAIAIEHEVSRLTDEAGERIHSHWRDRLQEVLRSAAWRDAAGADAPIDEDGWAPPDEPEWARLARLRELHQKVGAKRATVPKPLGG